MQANAVARPNIALIKYWGKRDAQRNLPAVGSISLTLDSLWTEMCVALEAGLAQDILSLNGESAPPMLDRVSACLDRMLGPERPRAAIESRSNFPVAAGLASSASAFAALVTAVNEAARLGLDKPALANAAGAASGSAARSLYGGIAELEPVESAVNVRTLVNAEEWPLEVVVAVTETAAKPISSGEAMQRSAESSPFYASWVERQPADLATARDAIAERDFEKLAAISEHNCLKMHSVMWASRPAVVYWNEATVSCMEIVRKLQADAVAVFFTIDAGPQLKAVCLPEYTDQVREALTSTSGVIDVLQTGLGPGAALLDDK